MRNATWMLLAALVVAGTVVASLLINSPTAPPGPPLEERVSLELVAEGLVHPIGTAVAPGIDDRTFIVDQIGTLRTLLADGGLLAEPYLDVRDSMTGLNPS